MAESGEEPKIDSRSIDAASRFDSWQRFPAVALLAATLALIVYGCFASLTLVDRTAGVSADRTDAALYVAVAARVADGESYYRAAATEHRERGYPLRPFVTVREPALAYVTAVVGGPDRMMRVLGVLAFVVSVAMVWRLEGSASGRVSWWSSALLTAVTAGALVGHIQAVTHEVWAGMLIGLSLALRSEKRFAASVGLGLAAVLVRELALPFSWSWPSSPGVRANAGKPMPGRARWPLSRWRSQFTRLSSTLRPVPQIRPLKAG